MRFSVVIPARNEQENIGACMESIHAASTFAAGDLEIIVVLNRCTDLTAEIALEHGARLTGEDSRNLSRIRNAGARLAAGDILVTIDADSTMSSNMLAEIEKRISSGRYVGGGVRIVPERMSPGIAVSMAVMLPYVIIRRISGGLFWCLRKDFEAVGGFDESVVSAEDIDFAIRLKKHGRKTGRKFGTIGNAHIVTSCRKFDLFGDWVLLRHPRTVWRLLRGRNQELADRFFYRVDR
jgi:glycosyltransferase involved in cell wall biosynthesis